MKMTMEAQKPQLKRTAEPEAPEHEAPQKKYEINSLGFLVDIEAIKNEPFEDLGKKKYDVKDFYWETGYFQRVAKHQKFENITLGVISFNALWMGVDTDHNDAESVADADFTFWAAEQFFAVFFSAELFIRFYVLSKEDQLYEGRLVQI